MVRAGVIVLLAALQIAFGVPDFMSGGPYQCRALLYSFFHANWWHLAANAVAAWGVFAPGRDNRMLPVAFLIAVAVYPLSFRPVIGFSNVLYAMIGLRTPPLSSPWWTQPAVIVFLAVTAAMVFVPRFSATTHVAAFALGMGAAGARRWWHSLTEDARRYL